MKILITGTSQGIGRALAAYMLNQGHIVYGIDVKKSSIFSINYTHFVADITDKESLPNIKDIDILINNAGVQNSGHDIETNLKGTINVTEKYLESESLHSILFIASASAHTGFEFPEYASSKAGVIGYMKNVASRLAVRGVLVNSLSLGGVITESNNPVMENKECWNQIMNVTPLKKWMGLDEICEWVNFLTIVNQSASGQDFLVDNGEKDLNNTFVWPR